MTVSEMVPDTEEIIYLDLPLEHEGMPLEWVLRYEERKMRYHDSFSLSDYSYEYDQVFVHLDMNVDNHTFTAELDGITDKHIKDAAKSLIAKKELEFRAEMLKKAGTVRICPVAKAK